MGVTATLPESGEWTLQLLLCMRRFIEERSKRCLVKDF